MMGLLNKALLVQAWVLAPQEQTAVVSEPVTWGGLILGFPLRIPEACLLFTEPAVLTAIR